jgi:hypothetical protein
LGFGKLIVEAIEEEADDRRREWRSSSLELAEETEQCNRKLERQLTTAAQSIEFKQLRNLHRESCAKARLIHDKLQEGRRIHRQLNAVLRQAAHKKAVLCERIERATGPEKREARQALRQLNGLRRELFDERTATAEANEGLLGQVRTLNHNTHALKLQIRNNCGYGGRVWFERREKRKQLG